MDKKSNSGVLAGYVPASELAKQLKRSERTLFRWRKKQVGPPYAMIGALPYYSVEAARQWLANGGTAASKSGRKAKQKPAG